MNSTDPHRISLIRDGINGAARAMARPDIFWHTFTDYIHLLFQAPCSFSVWKWAADKGHLVFTSFRDPEFVKPEQLQTGAHLLGGEAVGPDRGAELSKAGEHKYYATIHRIDEQTGAFTFDSQRTKDLTRLLSSNTDDRIKPEFRDCLMAAVDHPLNLPPPGSPHLSGAESLDEEFVNRCRAELSRALQRAYDMLKESPQASIRRGNAHFFNLFAVHRYVPDTQRRYKGLFAYRAALLLTDGQIDETDRWFGRSKSAEAMNERFGQAWWKVLQCPTGTKSRTIFDSVASAGFVDFGTSGATGEAGTWRDKPVDLLDQQRCQVEQAIYGELLQVGTEQGHESVVFYIPVHVGGVPWLSLFTFVDRSPDGWYASYLMYRDVVPQINESIRRETEAAYTTLAAQLLAERLSTRLDKSALVAAVNRNWSRLAQFFPYDQLVLQHGPAPSGRPYCPIKLISDEDFWLSSESNPFHARHVTYALPSIERIKARCEEYANTRIDEETASRNMVHTLKRYLGNAARAANYVRDRDILPPETLAKIDKPLGEARLLVDAVQDVATGRPPTMITLNSEIIRADFIGAAWAVPIKLTVEAGAESVKTNEPFARALWTELLDNAITHGPDDPHIVARVFAEGDHVFLSVRNCFRPERLKTLRALASKQVQSRRLTVALDLVAWFQKAMDLPIWEINALDEVALTVEFKAAFGCLDGLETP